MTTNTFDPSDLPAWAQAYPEVVELAKRDLAFRSDVMAATTAAWQQVLLARAGVDDELELFHVRLPASLVARVRERVAGVWGGQQALVREALERMLAE